MDSCNCCGARIKSKPGDRYKFCYDCHEIAGESIDEKLDEISHYLEGSYEGDPKELDFSVWEE